MTIMKTFESPDEPLGPLLREIHQGKIQLPDFQRRWIWDDEHIRSLLASVSQSFPVGAIMLLQTGGDDVRFKCTALAGAPEKPEFAPERLILDGQQRLTSLYQALWSREPVDTKNERGKAIKRYYYIDIDKALDLDSDREDSVISVDDERLVKHGRVVVLDVSTRENEYALGLFPVCELLEAEDWRVGYEEHWDYDRDRIKLWNQFHKDVVQRFEQYQIPAIVLKRETPKEAVCHVFEKVNTGGVPLTVFELLTATYAIDNFSLKDDWDERHKELAKLEPLKRVENTDLLLCVALLSTRARRLAKAEAGAAESELPAISCKRKDVLDVRVDEYRKWADVALEGYGKAAKLLFSQKIFSPQDLPYGTQLTPMAAILGVLGAEADTDATRQKLLRWYWSGVFGELYGSAVESRFARDLPEVVTWVRGGTEATTVTESSFNPVRLRSMRSRLSAAYRGLHALLLRDGAVDFKTGQPIDVSSYFAESIDIHHIFPQDWCKKHPDDIGEFDFDCIVNKTPLSATTNRIIGGYAPSFYLPKLQERYGIDDARMDQILGTHVVEPALLRADSFQAFFEAREREMLSRIERVIGKPIQREEEVVASEEGYGEEFGDALVA
jgi:hypothetical protein